MSETKPLHVEALGLANLRFFAPPSGGQEYPWLSIDDLHACLVMPRAMRRHFKAEFRKGPFSQDAAEIETSDGPTTIVPHYVAQGLIDGMHEVGQVDAGFFDRYASAGTKAMSKLTDGLGPEEVLAYIAAAQRAMGGFDPDRSVR